MDEDVIAKLENAFMWDFNITEACQNAGISRETYYNWMEKDAVFARRMELAKAVPNKKAKEVVVKAIQTGDAKLAIKYLTLRDPEFKPKVQTEPTEELKEAKEKLKGFMDDRADIDDGGTEPPAPTTAGS